MWLLNIPAKQGLLMMKAANNAMMTCKLLAIWPPSKQKRLGTMYNIYFHTSIGWCVVDKLKRFLIQAILHAPFNGLNTNRWNKWYLSDIVILGARLGRRWCGKRATTSYRVPSRAGKMEQLGTLQIYQAYQDANHTCIFQKLEQCK